MNEPHRPPTPYDGSSAPFRIGLKPLGDRDWIEVDDKLPAYLDEKARLAGARFAGIFAAQPGTEAAQAEVLAALADYLPHRFPETYRRDADAIAIAPAARTVRLDADEPPLWRAAQLVQEDLVLMRKEAVGWTLSAASLCFPSSWSLQEKFGRPMHEVHRQVPGFGPDTRHALLIERMFDNLRPEIPVIRWNWSLYPDAALYHPESKDPKLPRLGADPANIFIRVERQTLSKLPASGDILFTIRVHVDPLAALARQPDGAALARGLATQLAGLDADQLAYKGLTGERAALLARLAALGENGGGSANGE